MRGRVGEGQGEGREEGWVEREGGVGGRGGGGERARTAVCYHPTEWAQALGFISPSAPAGGGGGGTFFFR